MRRLAAAAALALGATFLVAAPAEAASGNFTHLSPDEGYDAAFTVTCYGGGTQAVFEGRTSSCSNGVVGIYVSPGMEIHCRYTSPTGTIVWYKAWDATGTHSTDGTLSTKCVTQAD